MPISINSIKCRNGFSLIEVLVSVVVMAFGILGMAGMQITSKRSGHEAVQRTTAAALAQDILERMRGNVAALDNYVTAGLGGASIANEPVPNCAAASCSAAQLAAHDLWQLEQEIDGATEIRTVEGQLLKTGGLLDPMACITHNAGVVTISIAWRGNEILSNPTLSTCGEGSGKYGDNNEYRQVLSITTYISDS